MEETFWRNGHLKLWKVARSCFFLIRLLCLTNRTKERESVALKNGRGKMQLTVSKENWTTKIQFWIVFKCYDKQSLEWYGKQCGCSRVLLLSGCAKRRQIFQFFLSFLHRNVAFRNSKWQRPRQNDKVTSEKRPDSGARMRRLKRSVP